MKIGLVGLGYWGKIILKNLKQLGYEDVTICEPREINWSDIGQKYKHVLDYKDLDCEYVFVIVPVSSHYEICEYFLKRGCNVFCEKPLELTHDKCSNLFSIADTYKSNLFVDWLFTYNSAVNKIKSIIDKVGKPKSIIANRMNFGPVREDVSARWDLASHDVSIACHMLGENPNSCKWLDFKRDKQSKQFDSTVGVIDFPSTNVQINASWSYGIKNRMYTIEFDNLLMHWDDNTSIILYGNEAIDYEKSSPLHTSIQTFMKEKRNSKDFTLQVTRMLESND